MNIHNVGVHVLFILWINSQMRLELTFVRKLSDELQANLSRRETVTYFWGWGLASACPILQ